MGGEALVRRAGRGFGRSVGRVRRWLATPAGERVKRIGSAALSVLILLLLAHAIGAIGWREAVAVLPHAPGFWLAYGAAYVVPPLVDYHIYRRWWRFGWRAMAIFLKKRVMNEALFSYAGESWFTGWAAKITGYRFDPDGATSPIAARGDGPGLNPATNPLAAIKDVNLTSGLAGNFFTMAVLGLAMALGGGTILLDALDPVTTRRALAGFALLILLSLSLLAFRTRVMSLPARENYRTAAWHLARVAGQHGLIMVSWMVAIPGIAFATWLLLGAVRLVIMRLPLPNREILFASVAVVLTGPLFAQVAALMAAQGAIYLLLHGLSWLLAEMIGQKN